MSALFLVTSGFWVVNPYIDSVVFILGHMFNFAYYKIKCREHSLTRQTLLEGANFLISLSMVFLLFQLAPNVAIFLSDK